MKWLFCGIEVINNISSNGEFVAMANYSANAAEENTLNVSAAYVNQPGSFLLMKLPCSETRMSQ